MRVSQYGIVVSGHMTEINSLKHAQKRRKQIVDDTRKGGHVKV